MRKSERAAQARRELDRKFEAADLDSIAARPRLGWIRAIRGALGMSQAALAARLGISAPAIVKLEHGELNGGITLSKLTEVAAALNCSLVYALVPHGTIEETVQAEARRLATLTLAYVDQTMALEAQGVGDERRQEAVERLTQEILERGDVWRTAPLGQPLPPKPSRTKLTDSATN